MPLEQDMINILRNHATRQIAFSFTSSTGGPVEVNQTSFRRVIHGLQHNQFEVTTVGAPPGGAAYNKNSSIAGRSGRFKVNPAGGPHVAFESLVVHESVHASFDLTSSVFPFVDNEVAAHIAQGWYYHLKNITPAMINWEPVKQGTIIGASLAGGHGIPAASLTALRTALLAATPYQSYIHTTFSGNG